MRWNIADLYDLAEQHIPHDRVAIKEVHTGRELLWGELSVRTNNLAAVMQQMTAPGDKVAIYMRNCAEYMEAVIASEKARLVPVNVNFRYLEDELLYILDNSDAKIVVYEQEFAQRLQPLLQRLNQLAHVIEVHDNEEPAINSAKSFEQLSTTGDGKALAIERSADDLFFVYTGGTTGLPKAVMWPNDTLFRLIGVNAFSPQPAFPEDHDDYVRMVNLNEVSRTMIPIPFMHGAGAHVAQTTLLYGGCVIISTNGGFDAEQLLDAIESSRAENMVIVGDAFAKPLLNALNAHPGRWNLSSLKSILSSATTFSIATKMGLIEHAPHLIIVDTLGASETPSIALTVTTKDACSEREMEMPVNAETRVLTEDFQDVPAGTGQVGMLARSGNIPIGYYKDPEKSAKAFPVIDGVRYAVPGDYAEVLDNGMIKLLGRGNVSINSGGEKIYPDEVECIIKQHPSVADTVLVGVPDERWGQAATAVVQYLPDATQDAESIREFVRGKLASYKIPRQVVAIDSVGRAPNGKADYVRMRDYALKQLGLSA